MLKFPGPRTDHRERNRPFVTREKYLPFLKIANKSSHSRQRRFRNKNREKRQTLSP